MHTRVIAVLLVAFGAGLTSSALGQNAPKIVMEEFTVPAKDAGIELYVRNKRPADMTRFSPERTVLFVHGATYPAETSFDLQVGGQSWMDSIAARGFDVYLVDVRGYGKSTRPKEMSEPAEANGPIVNTEVAIRDVGAGVDFILKRHAIPRLNLIGWSWGTTIMAGYTADNPGKVQRLALYAPVRVGDPGFRNLPHFRPQPTGQAEGGVQHRLRGGPRGQ